MFSSNLTIRAHSTFPYVPSLKERFQLQRVHGACYVFRFSLISLSCILLIILFLIITIGIKDLMGSPYYGRKSTSPWVCSYDRVAVGSIQGR